MKRQYVQSSNINSIGYDQDGLILEIEFKSGEIYQYHRVPKYEYNNLMNAASIGSYFSQYFKDNYDFIKL